MAKPALVVMAAGMGSRYGGLKQIDPVGPNGEILIDYSIYDTLRSGFGKVVFIIKKDIEAPFKKAIGDRISHFVETEYVYQELDRVPAGYRVPKERTKPWGTAHAVLCCRQSIGSTPFAVINADDFYGPSSFEKMGKFLSSLNHGEGTGHYAMVGFKLENTLTENGTVSRGVCSVDSDHFLLGIQERTKIKKFGDGVKYTEDGANWVGIPQDSIVSMNLWGFDSSIFDELENQFHIFWQRNQDRISTAEYFLPTVVNEMLANGKASVKVLSSDEKWYGITYREDKPAVTDAISGMIDHAVYPHKLWR